MLDITIHKHAQQTQYDIVSLQYQDDILTGILVSLLKPSPKQNLIENDIHSFISTIIQFGQNFVNTLCH
jgi:hypothetical protein